MLKFYKIFFSVQYLRASASQPRPKGIHVWIKLEPAEGYATRAIFQASDLILWFAFSTT